ncbi:long-chain N-acyl amino acid synthase [Bacteroidota bacterium]
MSITEGVIDLTRTSEDIEYRIATCREEREAAFRLVYRSYLEAGLGQPNRYQMRVTPYHLLQSTEVFVAVLRGETIFTVSLISDGQLGLPMENVYDQEVRQRREQGLRVGEVSCLADRRSKYRKCFPVFLRLCRLTAQYAWHQGLDQLLVAVHPRHARFYQRFMDFQRIGPERSYPSVQNRPAIALSLDLVRLRQEAGKGYETLFNPAIPDEQLARAEFAPWEYEYFRPMIDPSFDCAPLSGDEDLSHHRTAEAMCGVA